MNDLFDNPVTHSHDPQSSRLAIAKHVASGKRAKHAEIVLTYVTFLPGSTAVELWDALRPEDRAALAEMQEVRRRLCDLENNGSVCKGIMRTCRIRGSKMVTWVPVTRN